MRRTRRALLADGKARLLTAGLHCPADTPYDLMQHDRRQARLFNVYRAADSGLVIGSRAFRIDTAWRETQDAQRALGGVSISYEEDAKAVGTKLVCRRQLRKTRRHHVGALRLRGEGLRSTLDSTATLLPVTSSNPALCVQRSGGRRRRGERERHRSGALPGPGTPSRSACRYQNDAIDRVAGFASKLGYQAGVPRDHGSRFLSARLRE